LTPRRSPAGIAGDPAVDRFDGVAHHQLGPQRHGEQRRPAPPWTRSLPQPGTRVPDWLPPAAGDPAADHPAAVFRLVRVERLLRNVVPDGQVDPEPAVSAT